MRKAILFDKNIFKKRSESHEGRIRKNRVKID